LKVQILQVSMVAIPVFLSYKNADKQTGFQLVIPVQELEDRLVKAEKE